MNQQTTQALRDEVTRCRESFAYFVDRYCHILSDAQGPAASWLPFRLWPAQRRVADLLQRHRLLAVLKARQLGLTWLVLAFALWLMLFHPIATVLLFSRRDDEATDLLSRLRGMYQRLPDWLRPRSVETDNDHELALSTGSRCRAFPTTAGDSYTASLVVVDEADLVPDLDRLMRAVKPTVDNGGRMVLVSRADKARPLSPFKRIYRAARGGDGAWVSVFLPWHARPDRGEAWYRAQEQDIQARTGALDDLREQYPASDEEALAPRSLDKRLPFEWLHKSYRQAEPLSAFAPRARPPALPGLAVYAVPHVGRRYVVGADPAEGNPNSDESALCVLDVVTGEEVASLAGRIEPATFGAQVAAVSAYFSRAPAMLERNNHGHAVLLWLRDNSHVQRLCGRDNMPGWMTTTASKAILYDLAGEVFRDGGAVIHSPETFEQLCSIEGSTLRAPEGAMDDRAVGYVLALAGRKRLLTLGTKGRPFEPIAVGGFRSADQQPPGYCTAPFLNVAEDGRRHRTGTCGEGYTPPASRPPFGGF
jgi:hypothetical protein